MTGLVAGQVSGARGGVRRIARLTTCPACRAPVLAGLDDDVCAFSVRAGTDRLTTVGEVLALAAGRATFDAVPAAGGIRLVRRDESRIRSPRRAPVVADHACGDPDDLGWLTGPDDSPADERCPF